MEVLVLLGFVILELIVSKALKLAEFRTMNPLVIDISLGVVVMSPRPDTMIGPRSFTLPVVLGRDTTPVPTGRPDGPRDVCVSDRVAAGPPTDKVVPSIIPHCLTGIAQPAHRQWRLASR